ncbi:hypothetical protein AB0O68_35990, partial [Streptomyces sp. NPDC087512]|uniref:hypothetical protein n=1 Tax=Streptomyces sp. NPDC087512 TaxID=3155059 RepID=UPI0034254441
VRPPPSGYRIPPAYRRDHEPSPPDDNPKTSVVLKVSGLPEGAQGEARVRGPGDEAFTLRGEEGRDVAPGVYRLSFPVVRAGKARHYTIREHQKVRVAAGGSTAVPTRYEVELPDSTVVLDPENVKIQEVRDGEVVFTSGGRGVGQVEPGKIIMAGRKPDSPQVPPQRVTAVEQRGQMLVARTEPVTLREALPEGAIVFEEAEGAAGSAGAGPRTMNVRQKKPKEDPAFHVEFGGFQVGMKTGENPNNPANTQGCGAEVPSVKYLVNEFQLAPRGGYSWTKGALRPRPQYGVRYVADASLEVSGRVDVKCEERFESESFAPEGNICAHTVVKIPRLATVFVGPYCEARGMFKGSLVAESGEIKGKVSGRTVFDAIGPDGHKTGPQIKEKSFTPDVQTEFSGPKFKVSVELAIEVVVGLQALAETGKAGLGVELAHGLEVGPGETKAPVKGKMFLRGGLDVGKLDPPELKLFGWELDLLKILPERETRPTHPRLALNRVQSKDPKMLGRLAARLYGMRPGRPGTRGPSNVQLDLDLVANENLRINPPAASAPPGNDIWIENICGGITCHTTVLAFPRELAPLDVNAKRARIDSVFSVQGVTEGDGLQIIRLGPPLDQG